MHSTDISLSEFHNYFSKLQNELADTTDDETETFCADNDFDLTDTIFDELDQPISILEVKSAIHSLKRNKAYAGDQLINEYFIETCDILSSHLVDVFNSILDAGYFPDSWSEGFIVPILKKNDPKNVNNYRGITLVSTFSKIFTSILNKRLSNWAESNNVLSDAQFGFRKGRSTVDAIFVLNGIVQKFLNENKRLYCAFVDLKKAFDSVYLNGLWFKLHKLGIRGKMLRIIKDVYNKVKCCVKGCNSYSDFFTCAVGLKQGEVISPLMFSLFIEDLELFLQDNHSSGLLLDDILFILMLFADDMAILGNSVDDLQNSLNLLENYCKRWGLEVNTEKTKVMVFRKRGKIRNDEKWFYCNNVLEVVDNFNYLGSVLNYTGTYNLNYETLAGKGLKAMNLLLHNTERFDLKPSVLIQLFDAFVGSILNYSCEVNGFSKNKNLERIHLKFCKRILNVKNSTSNMGVYGELGRYPLFINRYSRIVKYWCKIVESDNILIKHIYNLLLLDVQRGKQNWCSNVKYLLDSYGFSYVWENPTSVNLKAFQAEIRLRIIDVFKQTWYNSLTNSSSLSLYKEFKVKFEFEKYLDNLPFSTRIAMSKLRLSSHKLRIETGRYKQQRTDRSLRKCQFCNSQDLEDEYHFLLICPLYTDIRKKYISKSYFDRPSVYKFVYLMSSTDTYIQKKLGRYVHDSFKLRKSLIQ